MYCSTRRHAGSMVRTQRSAACLAAPTTPRRCESTDHDLVVAPTADAIVDTVLLLEAAAIALGAPALTGDRIGLARATGDALRRCEDPSAAAQLAREFHRTLLLACPNAHMIRLLESQHAVAGRVTVSDLGTEELGRVADDHESILAMITTGASCADVERCLREHAHRSRLCALAL